MAKRRVFKTRAKCPDINTDLGTTSSQRHLVGQTVTLERSSGPEVNILMDGAIVGQLDPEIGKQVAVALERRQSFTATIENAFPNYDKGYKQTGAYIDIKVEYLLEKGQPAIETKKGWRLLESPESPPAATSFFTKVAGVTFEGRQRIVARCSQGELLTLVREPNNRHDKGAIKVMRLNGEQLGYIPSHVSRGGDSSGLADRMDRGDKYQCRISSLTGAGTDTLGVNIEITDQKPTSVELATQVPARLPWTVSASTNQLSARTTMVEGVRSTAQPSLVAAPNNKRTSRLLLFAVVALFLLVVAVMHFSK